MKKNLLFLFMVLFTLGFISCNDSDDEGDTPKPAEPVLTVEWPSNPSFDSVKIEEDMTGKAVILVKASAGIRNFELNIISNVLTAEALGEIGLSNNIDLINDEDAVAILGTLGVPAGAILKDSTEVSFDISSLVPLILQLAPTQSGTHIFTLKITDNEGRSIGKSVVFYHIYTNLMVSDIDLWNNTAIVSTVGLPESVKIQYRLQGETEWNDAVSKGENKFAIGTSWTEGTNDANLTIYAANAKNGVFAGHTYECRAMNGDVEVVKESFVTKAGDVIPNGDMANWSEKKMSTKQVPFPNVAGESFWDSGNNAFTATNPLCAQGLDADAGTAALKSVKVLGSIFAAGNMFTGTFVQPGMTGDANFGVAYVYTARPTALKLRYKAVVDTCDTGGYYDPKKDEFVGKKIDEARIFVAITDWSARHAVTSGMIDPTSTLWDPATQSSTTEGNILAYGSTHINKNSDGWVELILPLNWYVKEADKPVQEFSLVISCATSARGDYLTGSTKNRLSVDDFVWVY